jgi:nucleoside-diphosphate-sugar epimerase
MDNVLITGGAGFIGYHLANYYQKKNNNVFIFDNFYKIKKIDKDFKDLLKKKNVFFFNIDLTKKIINKNLKKKFSIIYHLAAINGTSLFYKMPYELCVQNTLININFLVWLENIKFDKLIYSSTSEVYAQGYEKGLVKIPTDEKTSIVFDPSYSDRQSYAISKFHGEFLFDKFLNKKKINGSIVRFHNIYGPRMGYKHVIPQIIVRAKKARNKIDIFGGNQTRAFCYIDDAIGALVAISKKKIYENRIFHIGNTHEIKIYNLVKIILKLINKKLLIFEKGAPILSVQRRSPNLNKFYKLTKFKANVNLQAGLKETIKWYSLKE